MFYQYRGFYGWSKTISPTRRAQNSLDAYLNRNLRQISKRIYFHRFAACLDRLILRTVIISQKRFRVGSAGHVVVNPEQAVQLPDVFIALIQAWQNINYRTVGAQNIGGDVSVQCARQLMTFAKIDRDDRYFSYADPNGLELLIDVFGDFFIREQHGSRQARIRSAEAVVQMSHHLEK